MKKLINQLCLENDWPVLSIEIQPDHLRLFLTISPKNSVATVVKILKGAVARKLFVKFPRLKHELGDGHLWSPSYYVGTAGNVAAETIKDYIERAGHIKSRR